MEELHGGRSGKIYKEGRAVHRPVGEWTFNTLNLLNYLHDVGFSKVPRHLGFYDKNTEIVSYIEGKVCNYPLDEETSSLDALVSSAKLLRAYHDATVNFNYDLKNWMLPPKEPMEVICHGDFAPYNVVIMNNEVIGIIDFDTAHPGPRLWDISYAVYQWSPLKSQDNSDSFGSLQDQAERTKTFCDIYGVSQSDRKKLIPMVIDRLETLVAFMINNNQEQNFNADLQDGHHIKYLNDIEYIKQNRKFIEKIILQ